MPTTALPLGMGLDRYTGVMQVEPNSMSDMRNLRTLMGKLQARRGTLEVATLPKMDTASDTPASDGGVKCETVCLLQSLRSSSEGLAVGWYPHMSTEGHVGTVYVFRVGGDGTNPAYPAKWGDLQRGAATPPYFTAAETFGKAFLAHDEAIRENRLPTKIYDAESHTLSDLVEDMYADTPVPIRFRGVERWSNYLFGWGYGWTGDLDRPEYVRASLPGEPERFEREHYFIAGDQGSPVMAVRQAGTSLVVLKPTESFRITGTSRLNFGIMPFYSLFGCLGTRLAVSVEGDLYAWGFEGPYRIAGSGEGQDLEQPLALRDDTPFPVDLPAESPTRDGFAVYIPGERVVEFHFGERIYALSLSDGGLRWSFRTRNGVKAAAGALMYSVAFGDRLGAGEAADAPPVGPMVDAVSAEGGSGTVSWSGSPPANTFVEVWLAQATDVAGADESVKEGTQLIRGSARIAMPRYERQRPDVRANAGSAAIGVPEIGQWHSVALRYRLNNRYADGYESDDPNEWPATSRSEPFASKPGMPTDLSARFVRLSATRVAMRVMFTPAMGHEEFEHRLYRDGARIATVPGGTHVFEDATAPLGESVSYTARAVVHGIESADSTPFKVPVALPDPAKVQYAKYSGPHRCEAGQQSYFVDWDSAGFGFRYEFREGGASGRISDLFSFSNVIACSTPANPLLEVRQYREQFGVRDYSGWITATADGG
ncbi:MAG: hypothetical protein OXH68_15200 [Gammaproteobacteria bacterium]|nr:hypothetical protein [Gammaproteobacteria bacterium]